MVLFIIIILSVKCPFQKPIHYVTFHIHSADITKIALSYNEQFLISTGMDGSLCIWKLIYPEGKGKIGKELTYTNEMLINKEKIQTIIDSQKKIQTIIDLNVRISELETEHENKIRQMQELHNDEVRWIYT